MNLSFSHAMITHDAARKIMDSAVNHARANGWTVSVAVVDATGALVAAGRMDGSSPPILDFATDKAFTAATMKKSTAEFGERMLADPALGLGVGNRSRLLTWQGGLPIMIDGQIVGGVGVSGATGPEDAECAQAALDQLHDV
jgi:glc operon protein GlcG